MTADRLEGLYAHHREAWIRVAQRAGAGQDAEDVVHDACEAVLSGALPLPGETDEAMMLRLIRLLVHAARMREHRRATLRQTHGDLPPWSQTGQWHHQDGATYTEARQDRATIQGALHTAAGDTWAPIIWTVLQEGNVRQMARQLKIDRATLQRRIWAVWARLRVLLAPWRGVRRHRRWWRCLEELCRRDAPPPCGS